MATLSDILKRERVIEIEIYGFKYELLYKTGFKTVEYTDRLSTFYKKYKDLLTGDSLEVDNKNALTRAAHKEMVDLLCDIDVKIKPAGEGEWVSINKDELSQFSDSLVLGILNVLIDAENFPFGKQQQLSEH